ncbi:MAG: DUF4910 domain-containing protein [Asgard group archaeon]|nr:DUF4910 domain-containing protein [Asgard group archaeon]
MFQHIYDKVVEEISGKNALKLATDISRFHRIQSSPGFRKAAEYCSDTLENYGVEFVKKHTFPAKGTIKYWGCPVPLEWSINSATLEIIKPKKNQKTLCRFMDTACSVIQRSQGTPPEGVTGIVKILPKGLSEEEIRKLDVKEHFILTNDPDLKKLRKVVLEEKGAAGLLYDHVTEFPPFRTRANFPSGKRYTSFWYGANEEPKNARGFVLSAEQGNELRKICPTLKTYENEENKINKENNEQKNEDIIIKATIDAEFSNGKMEVIEFAIPGEKTEEEIVAVAHLCHPRPGALDNASGCAVLLEVARTIQTLINTKKLQRPKRGIRFLLMAEFTGTYCYLASKEKNIPSFLAGLNLDMVGADQINEEGRTLLLERTPAALPSYVNDVLSAILSHASEEIPNFGETSAFAAFKFALDQPFSGGSDHLILSDPSIAIPTPMFIQWPDKYYHTSLDTPDKLSDKMLALVAKMTATYCYFLANARQADIAWIYEEVAAKAKERITQYSRKLVQKLFEKINNKINQPTNSAKNAEEFACELLTTTLEKLEERFNYRRDIELKTLDSITQLDTKNDEALEELLMELKRTLKVHVNKELQQTRLSINTIAQKLHIQTKSLPKSEKSKQEKEWLNSIPKRIYRGPISSLHLLDLSEEDRVALRTLNKKHKKVRHTLTLAIMYINGERSLEQIMDLLEQEYDTISLEYIAKTFTIYEKNGLLEMIPIISEKEEGEK